MHTTSIDNAAAALDSHAFYIRRVGSDGYRIGHKAKLAKVVSDRRASLDPDVEIPEAIQTLVKREFGQGASLPIAWFPHDASEIQDQPRLTLIVADPDWEWGGTDEVHESIAEWTRMRGTSARLYPGSLVWCIRRPGRDLKDQIELMLAWRRVQREVQDGTLGADYDATDLVDIRSNVASADSDARDEVWAGYRYVVLWDPGASDGLKVIDLGAGHASTGETLTGRIISALKAEALLNESVGAGYLERHWPAAFEASGAWPLTSLRQAFLNGTLTRLLDPDRVLQTKIAELVGDGALGLASHRHENGTYDRVWFDEAVSFDEVAFEGDVYLLKRATGAMLKAGGAPPIEEPDEPESTGVPVSSAGSDTPPPTPATAPRTLHLAGELPPEMWNRLGTKILPKLRAASELTIAVDVSARIGAEEASRLDKDLQQALDDLGLTEGWTIEGTDDE
jgi:hypothetical protein